MTYKTVEYEIIPKYKLPMSGEELIKILSAISRIHCDDEVYNNIVYGPLRTLFSLLCKNNII